MNIPLMFIAPIYLFFFLPLIFYPASPTFSLVVQEFVFLGLTEFLLLFLICIYRSKPLNVKISLLAFLVVGWGVVYALAGVFSIDFGISLWGTWFSSGIFFIWHYIAFFLILTELPITRNQWIAFLRCNVFVSLITGFLAVAQFMGSMTNFGANSSRVSSVFVSPNVYGVYLLFMFFFALILFGIENVPYRRFFWVFSAFLFFLLIALTGSRGALLGLGIGLLFLTCIWIREKKRHDLRKIAFVFLAVLFTGSYFIFFISYSSDSPTALSHLSRISDFKSAFESNTNRYIFWNVGWQAMRTKPVLGYGPQHFLRAMDKFYPPIFTPLTQKEAWSQRAHSFIFEQGVYAGFIGLFLYILIFVRALYVLHALKRERRDDYFRIAVPLQALLVGYLIQGLFEVEIFHTWILLALTLAFVAYFERSAVFSIEPSARRARLFSAFAGVFVVGIVFNAFSNIMPITRAFFAREVAEALQTKYLMGVISGSAAADGIFKIKEAVEKPMPTGIAADLRSVAFHYGMNIVVNSKDYRLTDRLFPLLYGFVLENTRVQPYNALYWLERGRCIKYAGDLGNPVLLADVKRSFLIAHTIAPHRLEIMYELASVQNSSLKELQQTVELLRRAVDLNWTVPLSHWYLALGYLSIHEDKKAIEELRRAFMLGFKLNNENTDASSLVTLTAMLERRNARKDLLLIESQRSEIQP